MSCEVKGCMFVRNKSIINMRLTPNWCFRLKYKFSIYKIAYYIKKKSESGEKHAEIKHCWQAKTVLNKYINGFRCERTENNLLFYSLLSIMNLYFDQKWQFEVKIPYLSVCLLQTHSFWLYKNWSCVDYCDVFISCLDSFWRHPFTAEDPLVSKWCNATFLQICFHQETNSSSSWMAWGRDNV